MIYNNIEFFNIAQLRDNGNGGKSILRFPHKTAKNMFSEYSASCCRGCEIRFVTESDKIQLTVCADDDASAKVMIYRGDYYIKTVPLNAKKNTVIDLEEPERFAWVEKEAIVRWRFSPDVWRIVFDTGLASFHSIDTFGKSIRPLRKDEVPSIKWLAYGSSITFGVDAFTNTTSYAQQAAYRLGVDVLNKGCGGACAVEDITADYFAEEDWDFATLEIGINMRNVITPKEFERRSIYMIDKLTRAHPDRKIFVITILPNHSMRTIVDSVYKSDNIAFNDILTELCSARYKDKNVTLINGEELLPDFCGLTFDFTHPSDYGHIMIGERLANILKDSGVV